MFSRQPSHLFSYLDSDTLPPRLRDIEVMLDDVKDEIVTLKDELKNLVENDDSSNKVIMVLQITVCFLYLFHIQYFKPCFYLIDLCKSLTYNSIQEKLLSCMSRD